MEPLPALSSTGRDITSSLKVTKKEEGDKARGRGGGWEGAWPFIPASMPPFMLKSKQTGPRPLLPSLPPPPALPSLSRETPVPAQPAWIQPAGAAAECFLCVSPEYTPPLPAAPCGGSWASVQPGLDDGVASS